MWTIVIPLVASAFCFLAFFLQVKRRKVFLSFVFFFLTIFNGYVAYINGSSPQIGDERVICSNVEFVSLGISDPTTGESLFEEKCTKFARQVYSVDSSGKRMWVDAD
jgi:hypothetical protein